MFSPEVTKRPRLGYDQGMDSTSSVSIQQPSFSRFLSNERDQQHPILSDKKLIVYDLKGNPSTIVNDLFIFFATH